MSKVSHTNLVVTPDGAFLNGVKIEECDEITIKDINPVKRPVVTLRVTVDKIDVKYAQLPFLNELREERNNAD